MHEDLIYDVGMNNGDDTAYYLFKGYRVVAIEADPALARQAEKRFADEIRDGRLTILNVAIAEEDGTGKFWICEEEGGVWSSVDESNLTGPGLPHHAIDVQYKRFRRVMQEHGVPYYLKIDIQGSDHLCIADIDPADPPQFLSFEIFGDMQDFKCLMALLELGFNGFKCISQSTFTGLELSHPDFQSSPHYIRNMAKWVNRRIMKHPIIEKVPGLRRLRQKIGRILIPDQERLSPNDQWVIPAGSSGPFGEDTDGNWADFEEILYNLLNYQLKVRQLKQPSNKDWFDIHATRLSNQYCTRKVNALARS